MNKQCESCQHFQSPNVCHAPLPFWLGTTKLIPSTGIPVMTQGRECATWSALPASACEAGANKRTVVSVEIDTDDDFLVEFAGEQGYYLSHNFASKQEAIDALTSLKVVMDHYWSTTGHNQFQQKTIRNPENHWFMGKVAEAIAALNKDESYYYCSNWTLDVTLYL